MPRIALTANALGGLLHLLDIANPDIGGLRSLSSN
jgi:hypothetical protein